MGFLKFAKNTVIVDVLERAGWVHIPSNFQVQPDTPSKLDRPEDETALEKLASALSHESHVSAERHHSLSDTPVNSPDTPANGSEAPVNPSLGNGDEEARVGSADSASVVVKDPFLVDWNGDDDPEHPLNWSAFKKGLVVFQVMFLTCVTYMGSSIYTPGQQDIQEEFHVGHVPATLNLSLYVLGYGIGPIIFSPMSEVPRFGRLYLYIGTLLLFVIFQIPAATVHNLGGLVVVRFIAGFFSSPSISTGGATMSDIIDPQFLPLLIAAWAVGAVAAPCIAPLLGAAMVIAKGWRWIFWLLMILCGFCFVMLSFLFPETLHSNILERRAQRVRKETGDNRYYTKTEADRKAEGHKGFKGFAADVLYRPFEIIILEPGVLSLDAYISLAYGCFYLFFESFPIVFVEIYHFTLIENGLAFLGFCVGCIISYFFFLAFLITVLVPKFKDGTVVPETFLILAEWACGFLPLSLLLFGWTASVHWILPIIWEIFFVLAVFNIFQSSFGYLAMNYPRYTASVFAGNAFCRSAFACAFPLFGKAMFDGMATPRFPVAWGSTFLAFITLAMCAIPFVLFKYGPVLRGRSRFAD